jgi:hypothetical protein
VLEVEQILGRRALVALIGAGVIAAAIGIAAAQEYSLSDGPSCPPRPLEAPVSGFHFSPGLNQHQSWIEFTVPEPDATGFSLCLDGRMLESGIGETPRNGRVLVNVKTTFVDSAWVLGQLSDLERPDRWELRYTTYTIENG